MPEFIDTSRFEFIEGCLLPRTEPNETHADVQFAVVTLLRDQARRLNCKALQEWTLDENDRPSHSWMTADVLVASNTQPRAESKHLLPPAILAVEVLSPGQSMTEMRLKALRYFQWGVAHVWIIDPEARSAITLRADEPGEGKIIFDGDMVAGDLKLKLSDVFKSNL